MRKIIQWVAVPALLVLGFAITIAAPVHAADSHTVAGKKHLKHKPGKMHRPAQAAHRKTGGISNNIVIDPELEIKHIGETEKNCGQSTQKKSEWRGVATCMIQCFANEGSILRPFRSTIKVARNKPTGDKEGILFSTNMAWMSDKS